MSERIEHVRAARAHVRGLNEKVREWGLTPLGRSWRSWIRHPIANARFWFWHVAPHLPRWEHRESTVGAVGHEGRGDADCGWDFDSCTRCGLQVNESYWENA